MPRICYEERSFRPDTLALIERCNGIIRDYSAQGYQLTLRQLYYQLVSRNVIRNQEREYKRLGDVVSNARLAGLVDWNAIEDRTRNLQSLSCWENPESIIDACAYSYRIDKWATQPWRVEAWVEKEALIGVLARICEELEVPYFACKGYVSQSELWGAAQRLLRYEPNQRTLILHLGDHDPSGIDMTRDIRDRLELFGCSAEVRRLALNFAQVEQYGPPPNPAKQTDARFVGYSREFGDESWELDALEPPVIAGLIRDAVMSVRDEDAWQEAIERERTERQLLQAASEHWQDEVVPALAGYVDEEAEPCR